MNSHKPTFMPDPHFSGSSPSHRRPPLWRLGLVWQLLVLAAVLAALTAATISAIDSDFATLRARAGLGLAEEAQALALQLEDRTSEMATMLARLRETLAPMIAQGDEAGAARLLAMARRHHADFVITREPAEPGAAMDQPVFHSPFERGIAGSPVLTVTLALPDGPGAAGRHTQLQAALAAAVLNRLVSEQPSPPGTVAMVIDRSMHIVARSADSSAYAGTDIAADLRQAIGGASTGTVSSQSGGAPSRVVAFARAPLSGYVAAVSGMIDPSVDLQRHAVARTLVSALIISALAIALLVRRAQRRGRRAPALLAPEADPSTSIWFTPLTGDALADPPAEPGALARPTPQAYLRRLLHVLDTLPTGVIIVRADGTTSYLNRAARAHFQGRPFGHQADRDNLIHPGDRPALSGWRQTLRSGASSADVELRCQRDGAFRWHRLHGEALAAAPGQSPEFMVTVTDIEQEVQTRETTTQTILQQEQRLEERARSLDTAHQALAAERRERAMLEARLMRALSLQALGRLSGGVAHTVNNMLTAVSNGHEIISRRSTDQVIHATLSDGRAIVSQTARLVRHLQGALLPETDPHAGVDVAELLTLVRPLAETVLGPELRLALTLPDGLWPARVDGAMLLAALLQVAADLRDHQVSGTLHIGAANLGNDTADDNERLAITLHDDGARLQRLQRRQDPPMADTRAAEAMGVTMLGWLAMQSGGSLSLDGPQDHGGVTLILPRAAAPPPAPASPRRHHTEPAPRQTVLLVDDNDEVRRSTAMLLRTLGFRVESASNLTDALAIAQHAVPLDLVITDVAMPGGHGPQLVDQLRRLQPDLLVIYMTGHAGTELARQGQRVLRKPFSLVELTDMVSETMGQRADHARIAP